MAKRTVKRGMDPKNQRDYQIFSVKKGGSEHDGGSIGHEVGNAEVMIRSNVASWGAVPVRGKEALKLLRDALVDICKTEGIK